MRDRLIELLREAKEHPEKTCPRWELPTCYGCDYNKGDECDHIARTADYLLANGVIVPPCKVGDTVWRISQERITRRFYVKETKISRIIIDEFGLWVCCECQPSVKNIFGKTVFPTREEAEKALAERNSDNAD